MVGSQSQRAYGVLVKIMIGALVFANLGAAWEKAPATGDVRVGGKVLCQDCSRSWKDWEGGNPIKGVKVAITCTDERHRVVHCGSDETDGEGQYEMSIPKAIRHGKELKPERCSVRLVSSPDQACNIPTDSGGGSSGVKLTRPTSVYRDETKFLLSPFYYTTPMCEKPDTDDDDNQGDKY